MRLQPVMDLYARRSLRSQERMIGPVCLAQTNIEVVVIHWSARERLARRQRNRHRDSHHWMRRSTLSPGERWLQEFPLQRHWLRIFGGDAFQIPRRRVARRPVPAPSPEQSKPGPFSPPFAFEPWQKPHAPTNVVLPRSTDAPSYFGGVWPLAAAATNRAMAKSFRCVRVTLQEIFQLKQGFPFWLPVS